MSELRTYIIGVYNVEGEENLIKSADYKIIVDYGKSVTMEQIEKDLKYNKKVRNSILGSDNWFSELIAVTIEYREESKEAYIVDYPAVIFKFEDGYFIDCVESDFRVYAQVALGLESKNKYDNLTEEDFLEEYKKLFKK
ncbi:hypothetical protein [Clostridium cuniculi]|uniref:hypothetical protein n=1 Tax=Clostridium cuniculi TaxID=2548455 RepID=UPI0018A9D50D|nr:hypothetical protein [Clostridium cuniculi]